ITGTAFWGRGWSRVRVRARRSRPRPAQFPFQIRRAGPNHIDEDPDTIETRQPADGAHGAAPIISRANGYADRHRGFPRILLEPGRPCTAQDQGVAGRFPYRSLSTPRGIGARSPGDRTLSTGSFHRPHQNRLPVWPEVLFAEEYR